MKFDMHTHTKEGSLDAKAELKAIARKLKEKGFGGMLVTDHNSYKGYQTWKKQKKPEDLKDFVVLKGIEYDTRDGGHMLVVLPDKIHCKMLELRGLTVDKLEKLVHSMGGILGPAHPYGTGFFAIMHNWRFRRNKDIIKKFDFVETFNSCADKRANKKAQKLAEAYDKISFAGSDAHHLKNLGTAFVNFKDKITCNNDLIRAVKEKAQIAADGIEEEVVYKAPNVIIKWLGIIGYWIYNKTGALLYTIARLKEAKKYRHAVVCHERKDGE